MAYGYTSGTATDMSDLISKLNTFVVARGWTQLYNSGTTYIWTTTGENNLEKMYIEMSVSGTSLMFRIGRYATSGGSVSTPVPSSAVSFITGAASSHLYWFFGDKDTIAVVTKVATTYHFGAFGVFDTVWSRDYAVTTDAESPGSNVVIALNEGKTNLFTVGQYYQIVNDNSSDGNYEMVLVTAINPGVSITVQSLANTHPAGAVIGEDPRPYYATRISSSYVYFHSVSGGSVAGSYETFFNTTNTLDPDARKGVHFLTPFIMYNSGTPSDIRGTFKEIYKCGDSNIASEDTITTSTTVYRVFNASTIGWIAIKESTV